MGSVIYKLDGEEIGKSDVTVKDDIMEITVSELFWRIIKSIFVGK